MLRASLAWTLLAWCCLYGSGAAQAAIDAYPFPNQQLQLRYEALIAELRCPQCMNTNLAGSDAMIAQALRKEVHRLLLEGKSDDEVRDFLRQRYGDFILYRPRWTAATLLLWGGPFLLLLIAALALAWVTSRQRAPSKLDAQDAARLNALLAEDDRA